MCFVGYFFLSVSSSFLIPHSSSLVERSEEGGGRSEGVSWVIFSFMFLPHPSCLEKRRESLFTPFFRVSNHRNKHSSYFIVLIYKVPMFFFRNIFTVK